MQQPLSGPSLILAILLMAGITYLTRAFPFIVFNRGRKPSALVLYLGRVLPPAIIALLVVYCLKDVRPDAFPFGLPELIACAVVLLLHRIRKSAMLSIAGGTIVYMLLIQLVFV